MPWSLADGGVVVDRVTVDAFALAEEYPPFSGSVHAHRFHQILFAAAGSLLVCTEERRWVLPPGRAAWIAAGTRHAAASQAGASLRTTYLAPSLVAGGPSGSFVFTVTPLARELLRYAPRFGPDPDAGDGATRDLFFRTLAALCAEWLTAEPQFAVPEARSAALRRATAWVSQHLEDASAGGAADAARVSLRSLTRHFTSEMGMSFRDYVQIARIHHSLGILAEPTGSVTRAAYEVGFRSLPAFSAAFRAHLGESPGRFRAGLGVLEETIGRPAKASGRRRR